MPLLVASGLSAICACGLFFFLSESRHRSMRFSDQPSRWSVLGQALSDPRVSRLMLVTFLGGSAFMGIESVFGLCVGCKAFYLGMRLGLVPPHVCEDCAPFLPA